MELLIDSSEDSVQHGQSTVVTLGLALLTRKEDQIGSDLTPAGYLEVFFTDILSIILGDKLAHDGVATDAADKAVRMEGDTTNSQAS